MPPDAELLDLMQLIASRKSAVVSQRLTDRPDLARRAIAVGGSRGGPDGYFLSEVGLQLYEGATLLHVAAAAYDRALVATLIALGAEVRAADRRGAEPLHCATRGGPNDANWNPESQSATIVALIEAGADPNARDKLGATPLHRAVRCRCSAAVETLLKNGADVRRKNESGSAPLHLAVQNTGRGGTGSEAAQSEQESIVRLLLEHGADLADRDGNGRTAIDHAKSARLRALLTTSPTL